MEALHAIVRAADGRGPATELTRRMLAHLRLSAPEDLVAWTYGQAFHWQRFAALAPLVSEAAGEGDAVALAILGRAAQHLADSALAVAIGWTCRVSPLTWCSPARCGMPAN